MIFRGVTAHFVRVPRYVLLLRRFRRLSRGESVIGRIVPNAAWGFAHVITVEDKTFGGDLPLGLQAFTWFYLPIVSMVVTMLIVTYVDVVKFFLQDGPGFFGVLVIWVAIYVAIRSTFRHRLKYRCNESNWKSTLEALILKIRKRTLPHSRTTAVIRLPDQNWKQCVQLAIADSSCVVIDLTEINSNVEWEIDQALKALPPEAIVMTWAADSSNSGASSNVPPAVIRTRLFTLFGGAVLDRCRFVSYPKGKSSETVTSIAMGMAIAEAISNGEAVKPNTLN